MRSSLVLSIAVALLLGGCFAEPRVQSAAIPPVANPTVAPSPVVTSLTVAAPVTTAPVTAAPTVAAPAASALCGGLSSADEARCLRVMGQEVARVRAAETGQLRGVMKEVAVRQARLDDPGRSVRCSESTVDDQPVMTCTAAPQR